MDNIAIVGCGAVTELMYVPAIKSLRNANPELEVTAVIDKNIEAAAKAAAAFGNGARCMSDYRELLDMGSGAVIITLPNYLHAKVATDFLRKGSDVFLEKPMGMSVSECDAMIKASRDSGAVLAVNHFRRNFPSLQVMKNLMNTGSLGRMVEFNVYEGRKYDWPLASHWLFDPNINKGGALLHNGCHTIDLLIWMLGDMTVLEYRDDRINGKGIEADCDIDVRTRDGAVGKIRMSFVSRLRNQHVYKFEKGWIRWNSDDVTSFEFGFYGIPTVQKVNLAGIDITAPGVQRETGKGNLTLMECFAEQLENFMESIKTKKAPYVTGAEAKRSIEFIEHCYMNRKPVRKTWKISPDPESARLDKKEAIAVLGASGFVGSALVQRLAESGFGNVRPAVRNYSKGAAVCQTGYPLHVADVRDKQALLKLFNGCSTVYHCAVGDDDTIVSGITNCIDAAAAAKVGKLIYISTARVFGYDYSGITDTSAPRPPKWNAYAVSKANAEKIIEKARSRYSVDIRILRPCVVWGPTSTLWTTSIINKILSGKLFLLNEPGSVCNPIYIENLIDILLLVQSNPNARNANFNVADFHMPWKEFIASYCGMLSAGIEAIPSVSWDEGNKSLRKDYLGMTQKAFKEVLQLQEVKDVILSAPLAKKYAVKRRQRINSKMKAREAEGGQQPDKGKPDIEKTFLHLQNCRTVLKCENLASLLNYQPRVDYATAIKHTREWLAFNGVI